MLWKVLGLASLLAGGCMGPRNGDPLVRAQMRLSSRQVELPAPPPRATARAKQVADTGRAPLASGATGAFQFAVSALRYFYVGGEMEAGAFVREGSNYAGAYGVLGAEAGATHGWLSLEVVVGRQWLRYDMSTLDVERDVLEPRLRAQFLLAPQVTLGAMLGANAMPDERGWTAGFFIGVYSHAMDGT